MERSTSSKIDATMSAALQSISLKNQSKSSSMDKLDDYCLDKVFSYLRVDDRACCERVCQRWKRVIQDSWISMKHLDSSKSMWELIVEEYKVRNDDTLMKTKGLSRVGQYLKTLELIYGKKSTRSDLLWDICKYCPNIETFNVSYYPMSPQLLLELSKHCKQIIHLSMFGCQPGCEKAFSKLFRNNKKLNSIHIRNFIDITGECLLHLPSANSVKEMSLFYCRNIQLHWLNLVLEKFVDLSSLTLHRCSEVDESTLEKISKLIKLKRFTFYPDRTQILPVRALQYLVNLVNLEYLELSHELLVTDNFLHDVSTHCIKLKILYLHRCESITDRGIIAILKNLHNLEHLFLIGTRITQVTLEAADRIAAFRRRKLSITYSITNFRNSIFFPKSNFLDLDVIEYIPSHYSRHFMEESEILLKFMNICNKRV